MKKLFTSILMLALTLAMQAQTMNVHFKNGTKVEFSANRVDYVDFTEKPSDPTLTPGDYVDLGLSVKWAACNLGASTPAGTGGYYAWGETSPKKNYTEDNYTYYKTGTGYIDISEDITGSEYDAATVNLGNDWRLPTKAEYEELLTNCTWTYGQVEGVDGFFVVGKNGNSIFLPKKGIFIYSLATDDDYNSYWCSTIVKDSKCAYALNLERDIIKKIVYKPRWYGLQIRPVYSPSSPGGITNITEYITITRTGSSSVTGWGTPVYKVTFKISNNSKETIHLSTLGGVTINTDLKGGDSYTVTLQASTSALQDDPQTLVFTYNGKFYTIKG